MGSLFISQAPPRFAPPSEINRLFLTPQISYHPKTQNCDEILFFVERRTESEPRLPCAMQGELCGLRREPPRLPLRRELAFAAALRRQKTEGEITRGCCLHRGLDENQVKKRSFAFAGGYTYCFLAYSLSLSLRLTAQILYAGIHLCPLAARRSRFGYSLSHLRTAAACLSRCIRHWRRSKAKPLRGRRGRSRAVHRVCQSANRS